jgi:pentapeptide MXKDX repeat protein
MRSVVISLFAIALLMSVSAIAQDTMKQDDSMKHDDMKQDATKSEKMSAKAMGVSGKVGDDGKTFVADKDGKTWKVSNPDALKGHEGHHVRVKARVDADKDEINISSVKMLKGKSADKMKQ